MNIPTYTAQNSVQMIPGGRNATPNDFGADIGQGMEQMGDALGRAAAVQTQMEQQEDVTGVHVQMAKQQAEFDQRFRDMVAQAQPGEKDFPALVQSTLRDTMAASGYQPKTRAGNQLFAQMSANMSAEYMAKAGAAQAHIDGEYAKTMYTSLVDNMGRSAAASPDTVDRYIADAHAAIDDPKGIFSRVDAATRASMKEAAVQTICKSAGLGAIVNNPSLLAQHVTPEIAASTGMSQSLLQNNAASGAAPNIKPNMLPLVPMISAAASSRGVNPNIMVALAQKESSGDAGAVNKQDVAKTGYPSVGLFQFQAPTAKQYGVDPTNPEQSADGASRYISDLLKKYGGDYSKALAAYNWGPGNLDGLLRANGSNWQQALPPKVGAYVNEIMTNAGAIPGKGVPQQNPPSIQPGPPLSVGAPWFDKLSVSDQYSMLNTALHMQNIQKSNAEFARTEAERAKKLEQESTMDAFTTRILDPTQQNGGIPTDAEIATSNLSSAQKQHMVSVKFTRARELSSDMDKTHPVEVRRLMLDIHAADDDPTKTYNYDPVMDAYRNGAISTAELKFLRKEVDELKENGSNFIKEVQRARNTVHNTFTRSIEGQVLPEKAIDASYRFMLDLDAKIQEKRSKNEDPRVLLTPGNKEYMLSPETLRSYLGTPPDSVKEAAAKMKSQLPTYKDYERLSPGDHFTDPDGNVLVKK